MAAREHVRGFAEAVSLCPDDDIQELREQNTALKIEGYYADLRRSIRVYYLANAEPMEVVCPKIDAAVSRDFDSALLETSIRQFRSGGCTYNEFCAKIMAAGCAGYFVSMVDRRAVYFSHTGQSLMEHLA